MSGPKISDAEAVWNLFNRGSAETRPSYKEVADLLGLSQKLVQTYATSPAPIVAEPEAPAPEARSDDAAPIPLQDAIPESFKNKLQENYGLAINDKQYRDMLSQIATEKASFVEHRSDNSVVYRVQMHDRDLTTPIFVIYNPINDHLVTAPSPNDYFRRSGQWMPALPTSRSGPRANKPWRYER